MLKITYKEYLKYEETNSSNRVKENEENIYNFNNEHDKVFREVLSIKEEALYLINKALKPKKEIKEEIELYNSKFVTSKYEYRESDIIYKVKNKNIFFIIEHQSTVDYSMVYRMLEYSVEIMRQIIEGKENKRKTYKYPLIIPIVIYTGDKKWNAKLCMREVREKIEWYEEKEEISLVDINKYTREELLEEKNILSKVMILEKSKNEAEFIENVEKVLQTTEEKNIEKLKNIIRYKAEGIIETKEIEKILKKVKKEKEEITMTLAERIKRNEKEEKMKARNEGRREGKREGRIEGRSEIAKELLKIGMPIKQIEKVTKFSEKEIEKLEKEQAI